MPRDLSSIKAEALRRWNHVWGIIGSSDIAANDLGLPDALMEEIESPSSPNRSIVVIALQKGASGDEFATRFLERSQTRDITGSVSLFRRSSFESYAIGGGQYHLGDLSRYGQMRAWFLNNYLLLLLAVTILSLVAALWTRDWLSRRAQERLKLAETQNTLI
jgi:hypothetical protein